MVAKSISHHFETMVETLAFVGIYVGIEAFGGVSERWCEMDLDFAAIHSSSSPQPSVSQLLGGLRGFQGPKGRNPFERPRFLSMLHGPLGGFCVGCECIRGLAMPWAPGICAILL